METIKVRGEPLRKLLKDSAWFKNIAAVELSEADVARIVTNGPRKNDVVEVDMTILNDSKKAFLAHAAEGSPAAKAYPNGIVQYGFKNVPKANVAAAANYFMFPKHKNAKGMFNYLEGQGMVKTIPKRQPKYPFVSRLARIGEFSENNSNNNNASVATNYGGVNVGNTVDPATGVNYEPVLKRFGLGQKPHGKTKGKLRRNRRRITRRRK